MSNRELPRVRLKAEIKTSLAMIRDFTIGEPIQPMWSYYGTHVWWSFIERERNWLIDPCLNFQEDDELCRYAARLHILMAAVANLDGVVYITSHPTITVQDLADQAEALQMALEAWYG